MISKHSEKLFCFAVKFVDQDRLAAEEDLQLRALYLMWKEFKEVVDNMEKRMMQSVDLETEVCMRRYRLYDTIENI